jgi:signal transduction histidine kinase
MPGTRHRWLADQQGALRRVATLVAQGASPADVFSAVTEEVGRLLEGDSTIIVRRDPDGMASVVARIGGHPAEMPVGSRWTLEPPLALGRVFATGRAARRDDYSGVSGAFAGVIRKMRTRSSVAAPIVVDGRLWGAIGVGTRRERFPAGSERRLLDFTELVATAIGNAQSRADLMASRARIVATGDEARRRVERDLHDGAQQRLVSLALKLRALETAAPREVKDEIATVADGLDAVLEDLREIARGLHPAILTQHGLQPALKTLARRSAVPVELDVRSAARLPKPVEAAAYYVVAETLTNAAKHAHASVVHVEAHADDGVLRVAVGDDGVGGADPAGGSGLVGLRDRVEALDGRLTLHSPRGGGTTVRVELPLADAARGGG